MDTESIHGGVDMKHFSYKEVHSFGTNMDDHILNILENNVYG